MYVVGSDCKLLQDHIIIHYHGQLQLFPASQSPVPIPNSKNKTTRGNDKGCIYYISS
jgi:hypothetical protein